MKETKLPLGIKIIISYHLLNIILWTIGQGGAVIAYDAVAKMGLQESRDLVNPAIVEVARGTGLADMLIINPLFIIAIIGLLRSKFYGAVTSWMTFGYCIYWPVVFWASQFFYWQNGIKHQSTQIEAIIVPAIFSVFALWASCYLYNYYKLKNNIK